MTSSEEKETGGVAIITVRREVSEDIEAIRAVNKQAFEQDNEATIIEKLRNRGALMLSLVALRQGQLVGHIAFSTVIIGAVASSFEAVALAPMAVLPSYQRQGIGSQLVRTGLKECHHLGHHIVVVLGHPTFYPRFGFVPAKAKGINCEFDVPEEAWMITELRAGALAGRAGTVKFQSEFLDA